MHLATRSSLTLAAALVFAPADASAQACGDILPPGLTTLTSDLVCDASLTNPGLRLSSNSILDGAGFTITMNSAQPAVRGSGVSNVSVLNLTAEDGTAGLLADNGIEFANVVNGTVSNVTAPNMLHGLIATGINPSLSIDGLVATDAINYGALLNGVDAALSITNSSFDGSSRGLRIDDLIGPWTMPNSNTFVGTSAGVNRAAIYLFDTVGVLIDGIDLSDTTGTGNAIYVSGTTGTVITNSDLSGRQRGVYGTSASNTGLTIVNNTIDDTTSYGVLCTTCDNTLVVSGNSFTGNDRGIGLTNLIGPWTMDNTNTFTNVGPDNTDPIVLFTDSSNLTVDGIDLSDTSGTGIAIQLDGTTDVTITNSNLSGRYRGVRVAGDVSTGTVLTSNTIHDTANYAIQLVSADATIDVSSNSFDGNARGIHINNMVGPYTLGTNTFSNVGATASSNVIYVSDSSEVSIVGQDLSDVSGLGIGVRLNDTIDTVVMGNNLSGRHRGVAADTGVHTNLTVSGNTILDTADDAIRLFMVDAGLTLTGNVLGNNQSGIRIDDMIGPWSFPCSNDIAGAGIGTDFALRLTDTVDVDVTGCDLTGADGTGIMLVNTAHTIIDGNTLSSRTVGLRATTTTNSDLSVINNTMINAGDYGYYLDRVDPGLILTNNLVTGENGFRIQNLDGPWTFSGTNDTTGVGNGPSSEALRLDTTSFITVDGADLSHASGLGYGILLDNTTDVTIINSDLSGRNRGISSAGVYNSALTVDNNDLSDSVDYGMLILGADDQLSITNNTFDGSNRGLRIDDLVGPYTLDVSTNTFDEVASTSLTDMVVQVRDSADLTVSNLTVEDSGFGIGLQVVNSTGVRVEAMQVCSMNMGVDINGSDDTVIVGSQFGATTTGVSVNGSSNNTTITADFGGNGTDVGGTATVTAGPMSDIDADGIPDACDVCPNDPLNDTDGDGTCDNTDLCFGDDLTGDADGDLFCDDEDCDDTNPDIFPGALEICDGEDNDCDLVTDEDQSNYDGDTECDGIDADDDNDLVDDVDDPEPFNEFACSDTDVDGCDDCAVNGAQTPGDDGTDSDTDGTCDETDLTDLGVVFTTADAPWTSGAVGSPSVVFDPATNLFLMVYETQTGTSPNCPNGVWELGIATSPTGLSGSWTDAGDAIIEPTAGTYHSCVAAHPTLVNRADGLHTLFFKAEQGIDACDATTPSWGCDEYTGVGKAIINWNGLTYDVVGPDATPVLNLPQVFGFPRAVYQDGLYRMTLSAYPDIFLASGSASSLTVDGAPFLTPGDVAWGPDETFNAAVSCEADGTYFAYVGGRTATTEFVVDEQGVGAVSWETWASNATVAPGQLLGTDSSAPVSPELRHWDVVRLGTSDHLVFSSDQSNGSNEIRLWSTTPTWVASDAQSKTCD